MTLSFRTVIFLAWSLAPTTIEQGPSTATEPQSGTQKSGATEPLYLESTHYRIRFEPARLPIPDQWLTSLAAEAEDVHARVTRLMDRLQVPIRAGTDKSKIILVIDRSTFDQLRLRFGLTGPSSGFHDAGGETVWILIDSTIIDSLTPPDSEADQPGPVGDAGNSVLDASTRTLVRHEVAHLALFALGVQDSGVPVPPWLTEGLACLFEEEQRADPDVLPTVNRARLTDLQVALGLIKQESSNPAASRSGADRTRDPGGIQPRFDVDPLCTFLRGNEGNFANHPQAAIRYAQAWGFVFYLVQEQEKNFAEYVRAMAARRRVDSLTPLEELNAFQAALRVRCDRLDFLWRQYILSIR